MPLRALWMPALAFMSAVAKPHGPQIGNASGCVVVVANDPYPVRTIRPTLLLTSAPNWPRRRLTTVLAIPGHDREVPVVAAGRPLSGACRQQRIPRDLAIATGMPAGLKPLSHRALAHVFWRHRRGACDSHPNQICDTFKRNAYVFQRATRTVKRPFFRCVSRAGYRFAVKSAVQCVAPHTARRDRPNLSQH